MIVVTLEFPDERTSFVDHIHASFPNRAALKAWLGDLERLGEIEMNVNTRRKNWVCPGCAYQARSRVPAAKVAIGRDGSFVDLE